MPFILEAILNPGILKVPGKSGSARSPRSMKLGNSESPAEDFWTDDHPAKEERSRWPVWEALRRN